MYPAARFVAPYVAQYAVNSAMDWALGSSGRKRARRFGPFKPPKPVGGGGQQLSFSKLKHGKKVARRELLMRLLSAKLNPVTHRWQNITNSASGSGAYKLDYSLSGAVGATAFYPVFLFDLTGAQVQSLNSINVHACPASRLQRSGVTPFNYNTAPILAKNADANADLGAWTLERNSGLTNPKEFAEGIIENVSIKLLLYGARKFPSKVKVQIVSFTEGYTPNAFICTPFITSAVAVDQAEPNGATTDEATRDWNAMWSQHVAPLIANPISTRPMGTRKTMKVHMSKEYVFQPKLSTELDVTGDQEAVFFSYKMNKRVDYTRAQPNDQVTPVEEGDPNEWTIKDYNELQVHARPEQRMFLMISGLTPLNTSGVTNGEIDFAPSFDICIRRKISALDQ